MELILQSERAECGLACLGMIAGHYGKPLSMFELRARFGTTLRGVSVKQLLDCGRELDLIGRALRLELDELGQLQLPCILHWESNHFVVLESVGRRHITVLDPSLGRRKISMAEASRSITGIALELAPVSPSNTARRRVRKILVSEVTSNVPRLASSLAYIGIVAVGIEAFSILSPLYSQLVVDQAISSHDEGMLGAIALGFLLVFVIQTSLTLARAWLTILLGQRIALLWKGNVLAHLLRLPIQWFERRNMGDIVTRFDSINSIQHTVTGVAIDAILDIVMIVGSVAMMATYSTRLCAISILMSMVSVLIKIASRRALRTVSAEQLNLVARESSHMMETIRSILPLRLANRESERLNRWWNIWSELQDRNQRVALINTASGTLTTLVFGLENIVIIWLAAKMSMDGTSGTPFTVGMMFAYLSYKTQFSSRISSVTDAWLQYSLLEMHTGRLSDIMLSRPERLSAGETSRDAATLEATIEFRNVSFRHSEMDPWILRNVSFQIPAGSFAAVQGPSGSGKTTLTKIMLGILSPTEGQVLYGGTPIDKIGLPAYRSVIGTVMQDDMLLSGSILENISFFETDSDTEKAHHCAELANIHEDISRLPAGYFTLIGDLGSGLSGGQRQRVLLARALYRSPSLLILDEATSSLDQGSIERVDKSISALKLTRVVVTHRADTAKNADVRLYVTQGRVSIASPSHTESARGNELVA